MNKSTPIILGIVIGVILTGLYYEFERVPNIKKETTQYWLDYIIWMEELENNPPDSDMEGAIGVKVSDDGFTVIPDSGVYKVFEGLYSDDWFPSEDHIPVFNSTNAAEAIQWVIDQGGSYKGGP